MPSEICEHPPPPNPSRSRQKLPPAPAQNVPFDLEALCAWFATEKRELPWRENPSPYAVWISEVMLQQTQAAVVHPYFLRWMERFPSIEILANAPLDEVIKMWEGLGYYSRARHLHEAAIWFMTHHAGTLPASREALIRVKGLGRYTVGAILSFAFKQRAAALDANALRVLTRYFAIESSSALWDLAERMLPQERPWEVVEGLIELGALVCKKEPQCSICPLRTSCLGFQRGMQRELPRKKQRGQVTQLHRFVFVVVCQGRFLVKKGQKGAVMADLYEFPFVEGPQAPFPFLFPAQQIKELRVEKHSFTRFKATLFPQLWRALHREPVTGHAWVAYEELAHLPFSSGHKKILQQLEVERAHFTH